MVTFMQWARENPRLFTWACFSAAVVLPLVTAGIVLWVDAGLRRLR